MAAVWTPWSSCDPSGTGEDAPNPRQQQGEEDDQPRARPEQRERQEQERGDEKHEPSASAAASLSRPRSAPAPTTRGLSASALLQQRPARQPELGGDEDNDVPSSPLTVDHEKPAGSRSAGDLPRCWRNGGPAVAPGGALSPPGAGMGEGRKGLGRGDEASSAASADFRRLCPSDFRSTPLTGCDFNGLAAGLAGGPPPLAVGGDPLAVRGDRSSDGESRFRPETLMTSCRGSSLQSQGDRRPGHRPNPRRTNGRKAREKNKKKNKKIMKKPPAASLSAAAPDTERGGFLPFSCSLERGVCVGRGGFEIVDSSSDDEGGFDSARRDLSRAPPSLSTQSSASSLGSTSVSIAATLDLWNNRELAAAKRAVSSRSHRSRLCRAMRAQESTSAAMAAAQRSLRAAFVMSKMGNAKERSGWRP